MKTRKALIFLLPLLFIALFWKPIFEGGLGVAAKLYVRVAKGWHLEYGSLVFKKGRKLVFSDLLLLDPGHFEVKVAKGAVNLRKKSIEVDGLSLVLDELSDSKLELPNWTYTVRGGKFSGEGIDPVFFDAERNFPQEIGRFSLIWDSGATALVEAFHEGSQIKLNGELKEFNPLYLRKWLGEDLSGNFSGRVHLVFDGVKWKEGSFHLEGKGASWKDRASGLFGSLDWEGPFESFEEGRLRIHLDQGEVVSYGGYLEKLSGELSFTSNMGSKWEFSGVGKVGGEIFPVKGSGRSFFQSQKEHWLESDLSLGDSLIDLKGRKGSEWLWDSTWSRVGAPHLKFIQSFGAFLDERFSQAEIQDGVFDVCARGKGELTALKNWELSSFLVADFKGKWLETTLAVRELSGFYSTFDGNGEFVFKGADLDFDNFPVEAHKWNGSGQVQDGFYISSKFDGLVEDFTLEVGLTGELDAFQVQVLADGYQSGAFSIAGKWDGDKLLFNLEEGEVENLKFTGFGWIDPDLNFFAQSDYFVGPMDTLWKLMRKNEPMEGLIKAMGNGLTAVGNEGDWDWSLQAKITQGAFPVFSHLGFENIEMELGLSPDAFACYNISGDLVAEKRFSFYSPVIKSEGSFDIRLIGPIWDYARLSGEISNNEIDFDLEKSHLLGAPFRFGKCYLSEGSLEAMQLQLNLPWQSVVAAASHLSLPKSWALAPIQGAAEVCFNYERKGGSELEITGDDLHWQGEALEFKVYANEEKGRWNLEHFQLADFVVNGELLFERDSLRIVNGTGSKKESLEFNFNGKADLSKRLEITLSHVRMDIGLISPLTAQFGLPLQNIQGVLEGTGHLIWAGKWESDFDFTATSLRAGSLEIKNERPLHVFYSSQEGVFFQGLDLQVQKGGLDLPWINCKIDLLHYDSIRSFWVLTHSHIHLPNDFLSSLKNLPPILNALDSTHDIDILADIECSSDFSFINCSMKEGFIPFYGALRHVQNLHFVSDESHFNADFSYFHQGHLLKLDLFVDLDTGVEGRLVLKDEEHPIQDNEVPLFVDWTFDDATGFSVQAIEGSFTGLDALFHKEAEGSLIGSARLNLTELAELIPPRVAQVFYDLKMGKGYELKGRLGQGLDGIEFKGLLSGKQIEFFNYQLRTLLGQIELSPTRVKIYDVKISDSAGMLKIDEILAEDRGDAPWTLSIPNLTITELRPSLIQRVGRAPSAMSPLVVRELKIVDFKGSLEDSKSYTADGELHFINSYRREYTVFDLAPDMLSRIVGLDLEILIPVCGTLKFDLKDGYFRLNELKDSYSEGRRTEFFLVNEDIPPRMDWDGNLEIFIKMKQFVLFKFTESFLISIEGKLDDPKFHLHKKKRFFGL